MYIEKPFRLTPYGFHNQEFSPDSTVIFGHYRQAHGQFLLSQELSHGTSFILVLEGMGVVKMNTFHSKGDAIEWIQSRQPMVQPGRRVRSKLNSTIKFDAIVGDGLEFWPVRAGRVQTPRDKFSLPLKGPGTVLAFDIECGDVKVSVTDIHCPQYLVNPTTQVFHPLHAKELKLTPIHNGSQVRLIAPAQQSLCQVNGRPLTPDSVLFLKVEGAARSHDTGCYFRLWTTCDKGWEGTSTSIDARQQISTTQTTTVANNNNNNNNSSMAYNNSIIFPIRPCSFQTFVVVVKSREIRIANGENSQAKAVINDDFLNFNHTLWVEFYKIGFTLLKTDLSWDWTNENEAALGPGIPEHVDNADNLLGMNIPPPPSSTPVSMPNSPLARGLSVSEENNNCISVSNNLNHTNSPVNTTNITHPTQALYNNAPQDESNQRESSRNDLLNFPPLPILSPEGEDENHNTAPKEPLDEGTYLSVVSLTPNLPPARADADYDDDDDMVVGASSATFNMVPSAPIQCPTRKSKPKSKSISASSPLKGLSKMLTNLSLRKPRSNARQRNGSSPPEKTDQFVNHGFFDCQEEYEEPVRHQNHSPPNDNSPRQFPLHSPRPENRSPPSDKGRRQWPLPDSNGSSYHRSLRQRPLPKVRHQSRSPPKDSSQCPLPSSSGSSYKDRSPGQRPLAVVRHQSRSPPNDSSIRQRPLPSFPNELPQQWGMRRDSCQSRGDSEFSIGSSEDDHYEKIADDFLIADHNNSVCPSSYNSDDIFHETNLKYCVS